MIVDLEDSIAPEGKAAARRDAAAFLKDVIPRTTRPRIMVRINGIASGLTDDDLDAIVSARPDMIMLPKAEGGAAVTHADAKLTAREAMAGIPEGSIKIVALATETATSLFPTGTFRASSPRLIGLSWGAEDLSAEIGAERNRDAAGRYTDLYRLARSLCLAGAAAAEVESYDTVNIDFRNTDLLHREAEEARRDGFSGMMAIHPSQVPIINAVFTPTKEAIEKARAIVAAFDASPNTGVVGIEGVMYDIPHLKNARRLLKRVG